MKNPCIAGIFAVFVLLPASSLGAQITATVQQPAAARGGVLAIALSNTSNTSGMQWPETLTLQRVDGGAAIEGVVAWIAAAEPTVERSWTKADEQLDIRPIAHAPSDRPPEQTGTVVLLATVPHDVRGGFTLQGLAIDPAWLEISIPTPDPNRAELQLSSVPQFDQPDPTAPAEWFRWWLIADAAGMRPPQPSGDLPTRLFAMHRAQLWQAGLDRIEGVSTSVASELRERLTSVSTDARNTTQPRIASWVAKADDLATLLAMLVETSRSDKQVMEATLTWLRAQPKLTCWIESDDGASVRIAAANASNEEAVVQLTWLESPAMPPLALRVAAHGIGRQSIDRPPELMPDMITRSASPLVGTLLLQWDDWKRRIPVGPARFTPRPPGFPMGLLLPTLSLADAQRASMAGPPSSWRTTASLRKRLGVWELFIECLRPATTELDELEVMLGEGTKGLARIRIHEIGEPVIEGLAELSPPTITRGSFADRWRCVIALPASWLAPTPAISSVNSSATPGSSSASTWKSSARPVLLLGVARSPCGSGTRQTAAIAVPAWAPIPVMALDPSAWWSVAQPVALETPSP